MGQSNTHVFVDKCCVSAFPSSNTSTAAPQCHKTGLNPCGAEAVKEVSLACDFVFIEVRISELSNIYLNCMSEASKIVQNKAYSILV